MKTIVSGNSADPVQFKSIKEFDSIDDIDMSKEWDILYYLGGYDGDLMCGWSTGVLSLPLINT